ncbi:uncharacterized protein GMORB2_1915 [Geosmithia morbida]|uniref:Uncharacterized protein n=1 Tax=Geosmithia morbida TaxID=1094350 RepID=A0A9P4YQZ4_9HYPO|nr:uncharacterized protein GMORB2_1915 [Geosmithia morbida]KAF4121508.1 uncharacterized protein GMORB2_1915 [Geosmithia morbida]
MSAMSGAAPPLASSAVRFVAASKKSPLGSLQLCLRVKPGVSKAREGIDRVTDSAIDVCVAAQPREGESNRAVIQVLSGVLGVPRSRLHLTRGLKSRDKTVVVADVPGDGDEYARAVVELLRKASESS